MLSRVLRTTIPLCILLTGLGVYRFAAVGNPTPPLTFPRAHPLVIGPRFNLPTVVTDEQLFHVLERLKPPRNPVNTNRLLHALRLWGPHAKFDDSEMMSGPAMQRYFLDAAEFGRLAGVNTPPLYEIDTENGNVLVRDWSPGSPHRTTSSYHLNDILATLAETGTPLDTPLVTVDGTTDIKNLALTAMRRLHLEQHEYEWSVISYARYVYPESGWKNQYGERVLVDELVRELIFAPPHYGACNGLHRLEAMVVLCAADDQVTPARRTLAVRSRQKMRDYMGEVIRLLGAAQSDQGYWTRQWPRGKSAREDKSASLADKILVTGHQLEWLALVPRDLEPPRNMVVNAGQWLVRAVQEVDNETLLQNYGPFTHAGRALCLWRSKDPYQAWRDGISMVPDSPLQSGQSQSLPDTPRD